MNKENKAENQEIRKELSPEATNNPLSWKNYVKVIGKSIGLETLFFREYPEDARQIINWIALEVAQAEKNGKSKEEITRLISKLYREAAKDWGFERKRDNENNNVSFYKDTRTWMKNIGEDHDQQKFWRDLYTLGEEFEFPSSLPEEKEYPRCGVPGCQRRGVCYDPKFKKLCKKCNEFVRIKRKKGYSNPYYNIEKNRLPIIKNPENSNVIQKNYSFWKLIQEHLTDNEWQQLWYYAKKVTTKLQRESMEEIQRILIAKLKKLPYIDLKYKKGNNKSWVFLNSECVKCGEKYEVDIYEILQRKIPFSNECPGCSGFYSSRRLFRLQAMIDKEISLKEIAQKTGYRYNELADNVSAYKKGGLERLAKKIGFPYFKISNHDSKIEEQLQSSLHPDKFI